jgi:predicted nucleic acid-binding protein
MTDRIFIDSNIWVYLFSQENNDKRQIVAKFISQNGSCNDLIVSYQIFNEVSNILIKKGYSE